jgi:hypothetical protein
MVHKFGSSGEHDSPLLGNNALLTHELSVFADDFSDDYSLWTSAPFASRVDNAGLFIQSDLHLTDINCNNPAYPQPCTVIGHYENVGHTHQLDHPVSLTPLLKISATFSEAMFVELKKRPRGLCTADSMVNRACHFPARTFLPA